MKTSYTIPGIFLLLLIFNFAFAEEIRLTPKDAWLKVEKGAILIDVRTPAEYIGSHAEKAINIPYNEIGDNLKKLGTDKNREIVLYCRSGKRSETALKDLKNRGFKNVYNAGAYSELIKGKL